MVTDLDRLKSYLRKQVAPDRPVVSAWSGGVDSTVVAVVANMLFPDRFLAVTVDSELVTRAAIQSTRLLAAELSLPHRVEPLALLTDAVIRSNGRDRCYCCKLAILRCLQQGEYELRSEEGCVVLDGTNASDDPARPGMRALAETGAISPLRACGLDKRQVRRLARELRLPNAELPSNSCLATRIRGRDLTQPILEYIEDLEGFLCEIGLFDVRARCDDLKVIVEVPRGCGQILERNHERIKDRVDQLGWTLAGYGFRPSED